MRRLAKFVAALSSAAILAIASASAQWQPTVSSGAFGHSATVDNTTITTNSSITDDLQVIGTGNTVLLPNNITVTGLPPGGFGNVINFSQGGNTAQINGTLLEGGDGDGIVMNGDGVVKIGVGGGVLGQNPTAGRAIEITGAGEVDNAGKISWLPNAGIFGQGVVIDNGGSYFGDTGSSVTTFRDAIDVFVGANSVVTNKGAITSLIGNGIEITGLNSTVNNSGPINAGANAIFIVGTGNITNSGAIDSVVDSIRLAGNGNVTNSGSLISHNSNGIQITGNGNITNSGALTATLGSGLLVVGSGNVTNSGAIQAFGQGILIVGSGNITNSGSVISSGNNGLFVNINGNIANSGAISSSFDSIFIGGNGNVTNSGALTSINARGILIGSNGNVNNGGAINSFWMGIQIVGNGNVTNTGAINSKTLQGILINGSGNVSNTAPINSHDTGILVNQFGNVVNSGNITSLVAAGITIGQGGNITNSGNISATAIGIEVDGPGSVRNTGNISTSGTGIQVLGSPTSNDYIGNSGNIHSTGRSLFLAQNGQIDNWGSVLSDTTVAVFIGNVGALNNWGTIRRGGIGDAVQTINTASVRNLNGGEIYGGAFANAVDMFGANSTFYNYNASIFAGANNPDALAIGGANSMATIGNWSHIAGNLDGVNTGLNNKLKFVFTGVPMAQAQAIDSYIASHQQTGSFTLKGETYSWLHFVGTSDSFSSYQQQGQTPNQKAIGRNLDSFTWTPTMDMRTVLTSIDSNPSVPYALDQLSPQKFQIMSTIQNTAASFQSEQINGHLDNTRGTNPNGNVDTSQLNTDPTLDPQLAATHSRLLAFNDFGPINPASAALLADVGSGKEKHVSEMPSRDRFGFFAAGSAEFATQDSVDNIPKNNYTTTTALMGVDYRVTDNFIAGLMGGFGETDANLDAQGSKLHTSTSSIGAYATYFRDHWYANGIFNYGFSDYTTTRNIGFDSLSRQAKGDTNGDQFVVNMNGGYDFHCGNWMLGPTAGIQYVDLSIDPFNESGAGAASLNVGKQSPDSLRSSIGGRVAYNWQMEHVTITPSAHVAWQHEILDDSRGINANFNEPGLGSFTVMTTAPERDWAYLGGGVNALLWQKVNVFIDYNAQVGQSDFFAHNVDAGARITW